MTSPRSVIRPALVAVALAVVIQVVAPGVARAAGSSTLTLHAAPSTAKVGDQIDLTGQLTFDDLSSSEGQTITLTRDDADGSHPLPDATTGTDGSFSATDTVDVAGTATYQASFAGGGGEDPSNDSATVTVTKFASHVAIAVSAQTVTVGTSVHLTAHLGRGTATRTVAVYAKPVGGSEKLVRQADVGRHRDLHATYTPLKDTTFIARYDGDTAHRAAHDTAVTRVRVIVRAKLTKALARSGRYHIYRRGSRATCVARVIPNHTGFAVRATLQMFTDGRWRKSAARSFRLTTASATRFAIRGSPNVNFRVRVSLPTHRDHLGDTSPWQYLRFR
jgi:hypothetical protein